MTHDKVKEAARERMRLTGESYTRARHMVTILPPEGVISAPFTPGQVEKLNEYQHNPNTTMRFTCGHDNCIDEDGERTVLVARERGWICPCCDYTQQWAHAWMAEGND